MLLALVVLAVLVGAMAQRVSGMGFALVVAPVLVLLIGPFDGVLMVNLCGAASALVVTVRVWRDVDWRTYALLVVPALAAVIPGALLSVLIGGPALQIVIGAILIVALSVSLVVGRLTSRVARVPAALISGATSGFMSASAGIGGPGMAIFAVLTRWDQRSFAATVQPYFATLGLTSFVTKVGLSGWVLPDYDPWLWGVIIASTLVGLAVGERVARYVSASAARIAVIVISYAGGVAAIIDGSLELLG